ncbi:hypothetical protein KC960_00450 [Candidatus Saccharibacteria bacterium]|nr:hypothetical protein [Candidatus Saccharibacteria bacterium]
MLLVGGYVFKKQTSTSPTAPSTSTQSGGISYGPTNTATEPKSMTDETLEECLKRVSNSEANDTIIQAARNDCYAKYQ